MKKTVTIFTIIFLSICIFTSCNKKSPTTVTDIDGNIYQTVTIGKQVWMAENLRVTHYSNGDAIPIVIDSLYIDWKNLSTGACCSYENDETNVATYGRLYNWFVVMDSRNISPEGWHVPTDEEWKELEMYLGMSQSEAVEEGDERGTNEGGSLKEAGTIHWDSPNIGASNWSGFSALPGGYRLIEGDFNFLGYEANFWSSTEYNRNKVWTRVLNWYSQGVQREGYEKQKGFSIRLVKN